jgi:hypothetical protein
VTTAPGRDLPPAVGQRLGRGLRSRSVHRSVPLDPFRAGAAHVMQLRPVTRRDEPADWSKISVISKLPVAIARCSCRGIARPGAPEKKNLEGRAPY